MTILGDSVEADAAAAAMEVEAFKRLYLLQFFDRYLDQNVRPDGRPLSRARPTSVNLGAIPTAEGSALVRIGQTTMLAGVKLEVMVPSSTAPDQGQLGCAYDGNKLKACSGGIPDANHLLSCCVRAAFKRPLQLNLCQSATAVHRAWEGCLDSIRGCLLFGCRRFVAGRGTSCRSRCSNSLAVTSREGHRSRSCCPAYQSEWRWWAGR